MASVKKEEARRAVLSEYDRWAKKHPNKASMMGGFLFINSHHAAMTNLFRPGYAAREILHLAERIPAVSRPEADVQCECLIGRTSSCRAFHVRIASDQHRACEFRCVRP